MRKHLERERVFGWAMAALAIALVTALQGYLAGKLSLWSDEFSAIEPALRPWRGEHNFWWQTHQYIANPPGENLILRLLYKCSSLGWLREYSRELFWRLPYIFAYSLSAIATYLYAQKWSRSALIASLSLALFLSAPGPFIWATETRFYSWAIFFMTCAAWEGLLLIENGFARSSYIRLCLIAAVGVLFHISLALVCYLLLGYSLILLIRTRFKRSEVRPIMETIMIGMVPFLIYKFELRYWLYVPTGPKFPVLGKTIHEVFSVLPTQIASLIPWGGFWENAGWILFSVALVVRFIRGLRSRNTTKMATSILFLLLSTGGPFMVLLSTNSVLFTTSNRYFLFVVPVLIAGVTFLFFDSFRDRLGKLPSLATYMGVFLALSLALGNSFTLAKTTLEHGSPAKINYDFVRFRDFYSSLPDRRKLVLVGVGNEELWGATDEDSWIGGVHMSYTAEFAPLYLNTRKAPNWTLTVTKDEWSKYEFLIFVRPGKEPKVKGLVWDKLICTTFSWGILRFCR